MKLYEITNELTQVEAQMEAWAADHEGDVTDFPLDERMSALSLERDDKALSCGIWVKNLLAESSAIEAEEKSLRGRRMALKNKAESIKGYVASQLPDGTKITSARCAISWRKSESVQVDCYPADLPPKYQKIVIEADKRELKIAIKAGKKIEDVTLIQKQNLQIK